MYEMDLCGAIARVKIQESVIEMLRMHFYIVILCFKSMREKTLMVAFRSVFE